MQFCKSNLNTQCPNKLKSNEIFCGIHLKCKNNIIFSVQQNSMVAPLNIPTINEEPAILTSDDLAKIEICPELEIVSNPVVETYTKDELFEKILNNTYLDVHSIRNSLKKCKLNRIINTKQSKSCLIKSLKNIIEKERYIQSNEIYLIKIQSMYRRWTVYRKYKCINDSDILTFTDKYDIPNEYFYIFNDNISNKRYCYDIRTLLEIIKSEYPSCPYTFRLFTDIEKEAIHKYCTKLESSGININLEKIQLSPEEEIEMKIKDVFHQINMLDNYTNHMWFKNLNLHQLIELYIKSEDVWNYRSNMTIESKKKIVNNGVAFNIPIPVIKLYKSKSKIQHVLLDEFKRCINEGINRDEKKLGAILILTALVEVSYDASLALPYLVQL